MHIPMILSLLGCVWFSDRAAPDPAVPAKTPKIHSRTVVSAPYRIDKKYPSMRGPYGFDDVELLPTDGPVELLWIVGYTTEVIDGTTTEPRSQEFMCHANLDFEASDYYERFPQAPPLSGRVFTLSQGQQDIRFPEGFGIPVTSDLEISLATQVLNLTVEDADLLVRHQVDVHFVRDSEVQGQMIPLYQGAVEGFKALGDARFYGFSEDEVDPDELGPGCSLGQAAIAGDNDEDGHGQQFTAHWVVPPGREVNRTNVTKFLNLQADTRAHYIAVHLHPFAETLTLTDLTTKSTVYEAHVTPSKGRVGIDRVDFYSSAEGLPLYKDHQYELTSTYNNTSDQDVDSMAVMYLYLADPAWEPPDLAKINAAAAAPPPPAM